MFKFIKINTLTNISTITTTTTYLNKSININYQFSRGFTFANKFKNELNKKKGGRSSKNRIELKPSYVKFTSEELVEKKKKQEGYKKSKTFQEYLSENLTDISELNKFESTEASQHVGPLPILEVDRKSNEIKSMNEPIFTDEHSSYQEIQLENMIKQLMIEQGKTNVSEVKIPLSIVEDSIGLKKEITESDLRFADTFFSKNASLETMAIKAVDFPKKVFPQVAFLGKSNVGKSTLLNTILHSRELAYVSKKPGCTKSINFYQLWEKLYLVDLPGYGFAKVSKKKSTVWGNAISEYLLTSPNLFKVFLLMDSRSPLHANDLEAIKLLDSHKVAFQIVLTKIDKSNPAVLRKIYDTLKNEIQNTTCCLPSIIQTSSINNKGIDEIRSIILNVTGMNKDTFLNRKQNITNNPKPIITTQSKQQQIQSDNKNKKNKNKK